MNEVQTQRLSFQFILQWIVQWVSVSIRGWIRIGLRALRFHLAVITSLPVSVHAFIISSVAVGFLPVFGWFRYSISLGETESYEITTNLWYLFFLPGATALLLVIYPFRRAFTIQAGASGLALLLYAIAFFLPEGFHYDLRMQPQPTPFYYAYIVALIVQAALCGVLKNSENGILYRMRDQWKKKAE